MSRNNRTAAQLSIRGINDLATLYPDLALEWDKDKNDGLSAEMIMPLKDSSYWWVCSICGHEWKTKFSSRIKGNGCPICARRKRVETIVEKKGALADTHPELLEEWMWNKNTNLDPTCIPPGSSKKAWWKCRICGTEWESTIYNRTVGNGCPNCSGKLRAETQNKKKIKEKGSLQDNNPVLSKEWHPYRNGTLTPADVLSNSSKYAWWKCPTCGYEWRSRIYSRNIGIGCPVCAGQVTVAGINDLATTNPELLEEWDYEKNTILPESIMAGSSKKKVWWKCKTCGNEWLATPSNRKKGIGCPICGQKKKVASYKRNAVQRRGSLLDLSPDFLSEWDYELNKTCTPADFTIHSGNKVWWKCKKCGNSWEASIAHRADGRGCPKCGKMEVAKKLVAASAEKGSIDITNPDIAEEWDYQKNDPLKPSDLSIGSNRKVWWKCKVCGHEWYATPHSRVKGRMRGCPECSHAYQISEAELTVLYYVSIAFPDAENSWKPKWLDRKSVDIYIPSINLAIEYDGGAWHKDTDKDYKKTQLLNDHGVSLIRIREALAPNLNDGSYQITSYRTSEDMTVLEKPIRELMLYLAEHYNCELVEDIDITRDYPQIVEAIKHRKYLRSFEYKYPDIAAEWNYEKNGDLLPSLVAASSGKKVWWKCKTCGHEWKAVVSSRSSGRGCPECGKKKRWITRRQKENQSPETSFLV